MASTGINTGDRFSPLPMARSNLHTCAQLALILALVIACLGLIAWPSSTMAFNTGLSLFCASVGGLQIIRGRWYWGLIGGLASGILGFASFSQYITGANLGLDQLFIRDTLSNPMVPPGRMEPNTSLCFGLSGLALSLAALIPFIPRPQPLKMLVTLLGALVMGMGIMALVGHLTGLISAYGWSSHAHMSPQTASGLLLIGFALLATFAPPQRPLKQYQQWQTSWSLPAVVLICLYTLVILNIEQGRNAEKNLNTKADNLAATIFDRLNEIESAQQRMQSRLNSRQLTLAEWRNDAYAYMRDMPSLLAIVQLTAEGRALWLESRSSAIKPWLNDLPNYLAQSDAGYILQGDGQLLRLAKLQGPDAFWLANLVSLKKLADSLTRLENNRNYLLQIQLNDQPLRLLSPNSGALSSLVAEKTYSRGPQQWHFKLIASQAYLDSFRSPLQGVITSLVVLLGVLALVLQRLYFKVSNKESELDELYQRQRSAMDAMLDGVIVINNRGLILSTNRSAQELFGYGPEELINRNVSCLMPEPYSNTHDDYLAQYSQTGEKRTIGNKRVLRAKRSDGTEFPMAIQITESSSGGAQLFTGVIHDLSETMATQALLSEKDAVLTAAVKTSPVGFCLRNLQGQIIEVNQAMADWFGYTQEEMIGMEAQSLVADSERAISRDEFEQLCRGEIASLLRQKQYKRKNGDYAWGQLSASAIKNQEQQIIFIAVQILDIHQSKTMALLLEERNRALERSNAELDQFAYVASHDLKAPLNAIDKLASWIEEDSGDLLPEVAKPHLQRLKGRAQRMSKLLDDLLMYSRVGREPYDASDINLRDLAKDIFELQGASEKFVLDAPDMNIHLPRTPLELVLRNLVANAIKHHHLDQGNIRIQCIAQDNAYQISVCDDGPGIPPHLHNKAMQMFQTLKPRDEREGSGMGLALCKKIIVFYHGNIQIESDGKSGTCIHIYWPQPSNNKTWATNNQGFVNAE